MKIFLFFIPKYWQNNDTSQPHDCLTCKLFLILSVLSYCLFGEFAPILQHCNGNTTFCVSFSKSTTTTGVPCAHQLNLELSSNVSGII